MSATTGMIVLFAVMWAVILFASYRLFTWLYRVDRDNREGKAPYDHGL